MANPSVTYTFTNSTTADGTQVSQNFTDLINGMTDGTKSFSIDALTVAGTALFNGSVTLGNASGDDITVTGSLASSIPVKTTNSYNIGDATHGLAGAYFGTANTYTARVVSAALAASRTYTMPDAGASADFVMTAGAQTIAGLKTFSTGIQTASGSASVNNGSALSTVADASIPVGSAWIICAWSNSNDAGEYSYCFVHRANSSTGAHYFVRAISQSGFAAGIGAGNEVAFTNSSGATRTMAWFAIRLA